MVPSPNPPQWGWDTASPHPSTRFAFWLQTPPSRLPGYATAHSTALTTKADGAQSPVYSYVRQVRLQRPWSSLDVPSKCYIVSSLRRKHKWPHGSSTVLSRKHIWDHAMDTKCIHLAEWWWNCWPIRLLSCLYANNTRPRVIFRAQSCLHKKCKILRFVRSARTELN